MEHAAVVPHDEVARRPAVGEHPRRAARLLAQHLEQRTALRDVLPDDMARVAPDVEALPPRLRVGADHRVFDRREVVEVGLAQHVEAAHLALAVPVAVERGLPFQAGLRVRVEPVPGGAHVRELGLPALTRDLPRREEGGLGGDPLERAVGVPVRIALEEERPVPVRRDEGAVAAHVGEVGEHLGAAFPPGDHPLQTPEPQAERLVALVVQELAGEHEHRVLQPRGVERLEILVAEGRPELDPPDGGPQGGVQRLDVNATRHDLPSRRKQKWGERRGLNPRPPEPQSGALPTELRPPSSADCPSGRRSRTADR